MVDYLFQKRLFDMFNEFLVRAMNYLVCPMNILVYSIMIW